MKLLILVVVLGVLGRVASFSILVTGSRASVGVSGGMGLQMKSSSDFGVMKPVLATVAALQLMGGVAHAETTVAALVEPAVESPVVVEEVAEPTTTSSLQQKLDDKRFYLTEKMKLLTSTVSKGDSFKPNVKLPLNDVQLQYIQSNLSPMMSKFFLEPKNWGSALFLVIISDILQNAAVVQRRNNKFDQERGEYEKQLAKFKGLPGSGDASEIQSQSEKEIATLKAEIKSYELKESFGNNDKVVVDNLKKELEQVKSDLVNAKSLQPKAAGATIAAAVPVAAVIPAITAKIAPTKVSPPDESIMNALVERERKLVEAIRSLVVREGMMAEGVANMMMSASAPGMLSGLSNDKGKKAVAAAAVSKTKEVVVKDLSKEMEVLKKEVAALKKENDSLQKAKAAVAAIKSTATATTSASSNSKSGDADKYVKLLSSEVDDLKQKLLSSDERLMDLQQESQSKVDSAKEMTKALNLRLQKRTAELDDSNNKLTQVQKTSDAELLRSKQAIKVAEAAIIAANAANSNSVKKEKGATTSSVKVASAKVSKAAANVVAHVAVDVASVASGTTAVNSVNSRIAELRALTPAQIKKMTKPSLSKELKALGVEHTASISKDIMIGLLVKEIGN